VKQRTYRPRDGSVTPAEWFWVRVASTPEEGCWEWTQGVGRGRRYGQFFISPGVKVYAHRFAYELLVGPTPRRARPRPPLPQPPMCSAVPPRAGHAFGEHAPGLRREAGGMTRPSTPEQALASALHSDLDVGHEWSPGCCGLSETDFAQADRLVGFLADLGWDPPRPQRSVPEPARGTRPTSRAAAESLGDLSQPQRAVLDLLDRHGTHGLTDEELNAQYPQFAREHGWPQIGPDSPRKRRGELAESGWVVDSGRTRPNRSGRDAVVWVNRSPQAVAA